MKSRRAIQLLIGLVGALAVAAPAGAEDCSPRLTTASEKLIGAFANAAVNDYQLGDRAATVLRQRADKFMTARYLQHHPGVESGREAFVQYHIKWYKDHPPQPPQPTEADHQATVVAHCDLVLYMDRIPRPDPGAASKSYDTFLFDMWRLRDGKADEHWDSFLEAWHQSEAGDQDPEGKIAEGAAVPNKAEPADRPSHSISCSASQIADNRRLLARLERAARSHDLVADAKTLVAADYVEHNPLLADPRYQGRGGFIHAIEVSPQTIPGVDFRYGAPEVAFADCDHIATVKRLLRYDYAHPKTTYGSYWFDVWRVEDGRLAEHWDATLKGVDYRWRDVDALNRRK